MQLSRKPADVSGILEHARDENFIFRDVLAVLSRSGRARISAGEKAGTTGRADWALAISMLKQNPIFSEAIDVWSMDEWIAVAPKGVETLLISAEPEDVWLRHKKSKDRKQ
jgi:hypothetical protein